MKKLKLPLLTVIISVLLVAGLLLATLAANRMAAAAAKQRTKSALFASVQEQAELLRVKLVDKTETLVIAAHTVGDILHKAGSRDAAEAELLSFMDAVAQKIEIEHICLAMPDGSALQEGGNRFSVADRDYFRRSLQGENVLEWQAEGKLERSAHFMISTPVRDETQIVGVLIGVYSVPGFQRLLGSTAYEGKGYSLVCDAQGNVLTVSDSASLVGGEGNRLEIFAAASYAKGDSYEHLLQDIRNGMDGSVEFEYQGERRFVVYTPLGMNGWMVFNVIPAELLVADARQSVGEWMLQSAVFAFFALLALGLYMWQIRQNRRAAMEDAEALRLSGEDFRIAIEHLGKSVWRYDPQTKQVFFHVEPLQLYPPGTVLEDMPESFIQSGVPAPESAADIREFYARIDAGEKNGAVEAQFKMPNGQQGWYRMEFSNVFDQDGKPMHAICTMEDVTKAHERTLAHERWEDRLRQIDTSRVAIYEHNLTQDYEEMHVGELPHLQHNREDMPFDEDARLWALNNVHPDEVNSFLTFLNRARLLEAFEVGIHEASIDVRVIGGEDEPFRWLRVTVEMQLYPNSTDVKSYTYFEDIHVQKEAEKSLQAQASQDALTGLLNRSAFERQAREVLSLMPGSRHALLMVDLDNFKTVNDTFGHMTGDRLLIDVGENLRALLRDDDLAGRIGGDEFMLLLKNVPNDEVVKKRAEFINHVLFRDLGSGIVSSVSIGIAIYPRDGLSVEELYPAADAAAYRAKQSGKNSARMYQADMLSGTDNPTVFTPIDKLVTDAKMDEAHRRQIEQILSENQKLLQSEINLDAILNYMVGGVALLDVGESALSLRYISPSFFREYNREALPPEPTIEDFLSVIVTEDRERFIQTIRRCATEKEPLEVTYQVYETGNRMGYRRCRAVRIVYEQSDQPVVLAMIGDITQVMEHAEQLAAAEKHADMFFWTYDMRFNRSYQSLRAQQDANVPAIMENYPESFIAAGYYLPEYNEPYLNMHAALKAGAPEVGMDCCTTDGRWYHVRYTNHFDEHGKPVLAYGSSRSIASRKALEQQLEQAMAVKDGGSVDDALNVLSTSPLTGIFKIRFEKDRYTLLYGNEQYARLHGFSDMAALQAAWGSDAQYYIHPKMRAEVLAFMEATIARREGIAQNEIRIATQNGETRWVMLWGTMIYPPDEAPVGTGCMVDVTAQKRAQLELDAVLNTLNGGFAIVDHYPDGRINVVLLSDGFRRLRGFTDTAKLQQEYRIPEGVDAMRAVFADVHPEDYERVRHAYTEDQYNGKRFQMEYRLQTASGNYVWVNVNVSMRLRSNGAYRLYVSYVDINDLKEAMQALEAQKNAPAEA